MAKKTKTKALTATTNNLVIIPPKMDINLKSNIRDVKKNIKTGRTPANSVSSEDYSYKKTVSKKSSEKNKILLTRKIKKSKK